MHRAPTAAPPPARSIATRGRHGLALGALVAIALGSARPARADLDGETFTSPEYGVRAEVPRGWRVSEVSGYPRVLLVMSRSTPPARLYVTIDPIVPGCRTELDAVFCSADPTAAVTRLRERLDATGFRITAQTLSRTPELEYEAGDHFVRHALIVIDDHVVSVILATRSTSGRSSLRRVFDRLTQSVRAAPP